MIHYRNPSTKNSIIFYPSNQNSKISKTIVSSPRTGYTIYENDAINNFYLRKALYEINKQKKNLYKHDRSLSLTLLNFNDKKSNKKNLLKREIEYVSKNIISDRDLNRLKHGSKNNRPAINYLATGRNNGINNVLNSDCSKTLFNYGLRNYGLRGIVPVSPSSKKRYNWNKGKGFSNKNESQLEYYKYIYDMKKIHYSLRNHKIK